MSMLERVYRKGGWKTALGFRKAWLSLGLFALVLANGPAWSQQAGVTNSTIRIGGVMPLEGDAKALGQGMKAGIEAAFKGEKVQGRGIEFLALNDFYNPTDTAKATRQLIDQGIFLMLGNVGTPTAQAALPMLNQDKIPAVGFFTGADLLRPGVGDIINLRASYVQETDSVIKAAIAAGVKPREICAFVQNDGYGMAGVKGIKLALADQPGTADIIKRLDEILAMQGENPARNGKGPVGVYPRNTLVVREGYESLKAWEKASNTPCRLVVTVGVYNPIGNFIGYARYKGEKWTYSAVSFTGADNLVETLKRFQVADNVIMTQVVPALDSPLPIVDEARRVLGNELNYISLEGFIAGKMTLAILRGIKGDITRENFMKAARGQKFDIGGFALDFANDNQGSDFIQPTQLQKGVFVPIALQQLAVVFK